MKYELPVDYNKIPWRQIKDVRDQYTQEQNGICLFCGGDLHSKPPEYIKEIPIDWSYFPVGFFKNPTHLYYRRDTGMTVGTVHQKCNAVIWKYELENTWKANTT